MTDAEPPAEAEKTADAPLGFDNTPSAELQAKRAAVGLAPLAPSVKVFSWTASQVWRQAADGSTSEVTPEALSRMKLRLSRLGLPCDAAAVAEFQRYAGGYAVAEALEPVREAWPEQMHCRTDHVTYVVASGRCRFELSHEAMRDAAAGERLVARATAGNGVTVLKNVPHRLVPEESNTAVIPLFNGEASTAGSGLMARLQSGPVT